MQDLESRHQILSRFSGATVVINYLKRTGDLETCEVNPFFPLARAILLDIQLGDQLIPKERREAMA